MGIMTHAKFHFNWLMLTLIFGIRASEPPPPPPPPAWRTTEKAWPNRVKANEILNINSLQLTTSTILNINSLQLKKKFAVSIKTILKRIRVDGA